MVWSEVKKRVSEDLWAQTRGNWPRTENTGAARRAIDCPRRPTRHVDVAWERRGKVRGGRRGGRGAGSFEIARAGRKKDGEWGAGGRQDAGGTVKVRAAGARVLQS